jgi:hypothetical protein
MAIEAGPYCQRCLDSDGKLQPFEERFERMVPWQLRQKKGRARAPAARETLACASRATCPAA